jgi:hypothetical protein
MTAQGNTASPFETFAQNSQSKPASLSQQPIIWIVVLSCIVVAAFIIATFLLCKCRRRRRNKSSGRVERGYSVSDGRNEFKAWNRDAQPMTPLPPAPMYGEYGARAIEMTPVAKAPVKSALMEPMVEPMIVEVEDADEGSGYSSRSRRTAGSRYYSGWLGG